MESETNLAHFLFFRLLCTTFTTIDSSNSVHSLYFCMYITCNGYICHILPILPGFLPWMGPEPDSYSSSWRLTPITPLRNDESASSWQASSRRFNCTCLSNRLNLNLILRFVGSNDSSKEYPWLRVWCIKP